MQSPSEKPCDICSDIGMAEVLVTCSKCNNSRQHIYCMHPNLCKLPVSWFCQPYNLCRKVRVEVPGKGSLKISDVCTKVKVEELGMASPKISDACRKVKVEELGMESLKVSDAAEIVRLPSCQPGKAMLASEGDARALALGTKERSVLTVNVLTEKKPIVTSPMQISSVGHKPDAPATTFSNSIKMEEGTSSIKEIRFDVQI